MADPLYDPFRSLREIQRQLDKMNEPLRKFQALGAHRYFDQVDAVSRLVVGPSDAVRRAVESIQGPDRQMRRIYRQLTDATKPYEIAKSLDWAADLGRKFERAYRAGLPVNWRELPGGDTERARDLVVDHGLPIIWVPNAALTEKALAAGGPEDAMAMLLASREEVFADIDAALGEVTDAKFAQLVKMARKALDAARGGHPEAAQALAATVFTAALTTEDGVGYKNFGEVRRMAERHPPDQAGIRTYRTTLVVTLCARYLQSYGRQAGFNRNGTLHTVSDEHYTDSLSLASLMAVAGLLREFQQRIEEIAADESDEDEFAEAA